VKFVLAIQDAPSIMQDVLAEVVAFQAIFHDLQLHILDSPDRSEEGKEMINIDQLVITLIGCVSRFTKLEIILGCLETNSSSIDILSRARWARKDQDLARILRGLQNQKSSLIVILSILLKMDIEKLNCILSKRATRPYIYERSTAECHQLVSESTVISGHTRHHRLRPYKTSSSPAIQDTPSPAIRDSSPAETCICNKSLTGW